jgi:hypothetical protein
MAMEMETKIEFLNKDATRLAFESRYGTIHAWTGTPEQCEARSQALYQFRRELIETDLFPGVTQLFTDSTTHPQRNLVVGINVAPEDMIFQYPVGDARHCLCASAEVTYHSPAKCVRFTIGDIVATSVTGLEYALVLEIATNSRMGWIELALAGVVLNDRRSFTFTGMVHCADFLDASCVKRVVTHINHNNWFEVARFAGICDFTGIGEPLMHIFWHVEATELEKAAATAWIVRHVVTATLQKCVADSLCTYRTKLLESMDLVPRHRINNATLLIVQSARALPAPHMMDVITGYCDPLEVSDYGPDGRSINYLGWVKML